MYIRSPLPLILKLTVLHVHVNVLESHYNKCIHTHIEATDMYVWQMQ